MLKSLNVSRPFNDTKKNVDYSLSDFKSWEDKEIIKSIYWFVFNLWNNIKINGTEYYIFLVVANKN